MNTFCTYYNQGICKSCNKIESSYEEQIRQKENYLKTLLADNFSHDLLTTVTSKTTGFRNKAKLVVTGTIENPSFGLTGEEELDQGRDIKDCPLHAKQINEVVHSLPEFIRLTHLAPYQIKEKKGELKGIILYYSELSRSMYLRFILRSKESSDRIKKHYPSLIQKHPYLKCVSLNIQPIAHAILEGEEEIFLTNETFIPHQIDSIQTTLDPKGFVQTNQEVATKLYSTAAQWVKELKAKKFLELFSGQGAFSFFVQSQVEEAIGFEINAEAVERANQTAAKLGMRHLRFIARDAAQAQAEMQDMKPDVILVNPPRRGLGASIELFKRSSAPYLIYSSCNAETLAKDISELALFYKIEKVQMFDMFPHTEHFETLVLLKSTGVC